MTEEVLGREGGKLLVNWGQLASPTRLPRHTRWVSAKTSRCACSLTPQVRSDFVGSKISTDAGLVAYRELDWRLGLTAAAGQFLTEQRTGRNIQHELVPLLRQSVYSRLAGYPDTNDADRLARDPVAAVGGEPPGA